MGLWSQLKKYSASQVAQESICSERASDIPVSDRFCRTDAISFPIGESQLVYSLLDQSTQTISHQLFDILNHCQTFKTLDELVMDYLDAYIGTDPQLVEEQLAALIDAKLLISETAFSELIKDSPAPQNSPEGIASIGVITRNRIESLQRSLESHIDNTRKYTRTNDFVVMDDSELANAGSNTRQMLSALKANYDVKISYGGGKEKQRFMEALLTEHHLPPDVVNFALSDTEQCGCAIGANRNALLLHSTGDMIFSADDDIIGRVVGSPVSKEGLSFDSSGNFMQFWFFPDRDKALQSDFIDRDILKCHELLLGKTLAECVSQPVNSLLPTFDRVNSRQIRSIKSGRGRVLATLNGTVGDSGISAPVHYLTLDGESRQRMVQSKSAYLSAFKSREVLRVVDRLYISNKGWFAAGALGLDNRELLPPFMPVQRGEDDLFGFTVRACFIDGYFGYLPEAMLHSPSEQRMHQPDSIHDFASSLRFNNIVVACVASFNVWTTMLNTTERFAALGKHLIELGSMTLQDFEEFVRINLWRMQSDYISFLVAHLDSYDGSPDFWANDVEQFIDTLRTAMADPDYLVPGDLLENRSAEEARKLSQRLVLKFGQLLYWWPEIVNAARNLRAKGQRLATAV